MGEPAGAGPARLDGPGRAGRAADLRSSSARAGSRCRALTGALALAAGLLLSSCTSGSEVTPMRPSFRPSASRSAPGPVRHDAEPLTKRFSALGDPVAVTWQSGTIGDRSVPGPSTYWIDAAVQVSPSVATSLRDTPGLGEVDLSDLPGDVLAAAGDGPWQAGEALNVAFSTPGYDTQAYLGAGDVLVLRAVDRARPADRRGQDRRRRPLHAQ